MAQLPPEGAFGDYGEWPGRAVLDSGGDRVGGVREIYLDRETGRPEWVLVEVEDDESRFVPLADAEVAADSIRLAHSASVVRSAPTIGPDAHIDNDQERRLYAHYGLGYSEDESGSGLPTDDQPTAEWPAGAGEEPPATAEAAPLWSDVADAADSPAAADSPDDAAADVPAAPATGADLPLVAGEPFPGAAPPLGTSGDEPFSAVADAAPSEDAPVAVPFGTPGPADEVLRETVAPEPPRAFPPPPPPPDPGGGSLPVVGTRRRLGLAGGAALVAAVLFLVVRKLRS